MDLTDFLQTSCIVGLTFAVWHSHIVLKSHAKYTSLYVDNLQEQIKLLAKMSHFKADTSRDESTADLSG